MQLYAFYFKIYIMIHLPEFNYVGIGANSEAEMIEAITGMPPLRIGQAAIVANVELCTQTIKEIPSTPPTPGMPSAVDVLTRGWGEDINMDKFEAYTPRQIRWATTKGTLFALEREALDAVWNWQLVEFDWFEPVRVEAAPVTRGESIQVWTELIKGNQPVARTPDGRNYRPYLMGEKLTLAKAVKARLAA
ncbi:MAG: hypothetical protein JWO47_941 [Candidatus Saccharibacteria bacterium]|nr:hypothetical protein [Candidatus Saccharibacteria bacterium]